MFRPLKKRMLLLPCIVYRQGSLFFLLQIVLTASLLAQTVGLATEGSSRVFEPLYDSYVAPEPRQSIPKNAEEYARMHLEEVRSFFLERKDEPQADRLRRMAQEKRRQSVNTLSLSLRRLLFEEGLLDDPEDPVEIEMAGARMLVNGLETTPRQAQRLRQMMKSCGYAGEGNKSLNLNM